MFVLQNAPEGRLEIPGLDLRAGGSADDDGQVRREPLRRRTDATICRCCSSTTAICSTSETAERMLDHYVRLLDRGGARRRIARFGALPMLAPAERTRVLTEWNATRTDYPRDASIHRLFAELAARMPDAVAVRLRHRRR